jgi:hypothetical protein
LKQKKDNTLNEEDIMPGTYTGYVNSIKAKYGKTPEDFYKLAMKKVLLRRARSLRSMPNY